MCVVLLIDKNAPAPPPMINRAIDLTVQTKADLGGTSEGLSVSAKTGFGIPELRSRLDELCFGQSHGARDQVALTGRHIRAIEEAVRAVQRAREAIASGAEIVAMELREALDQLGSIRGVVSSDDVLGRVFARFCIGK